MHEEKLKRRMQKSVALASMAAFLLMPVNLAYGANNNITAGSSGIGSLTNISGGKSDYTNITSGFVQNGTGINHFGKFEVNGSADLNGANRYVNMVDGFANINGLLNAFKINGSIPANVMFISPEGMAVGANGVLNVGGLQIITPTTSDYNSLLQKAGTDVTTITLSEADFANLRNGGDGVVLIGGKVYSTDDVVIQAGNGIYFQNGGLINTNTSIGEVKGIGSISLFTNTGDIVGSSDIHLDSVGNIVLSAKNGGIGQGKTQNQNLYGEKITITPFNVKLAEGKTLDVEVSNTLTDAGDFKGYASVANNSKNLNVGTVKGSNIKIVNNGDGILTTTKAITGADKVYLNAENGSLKVNEDVSAKEIVRLNGKDGIVATGNLEVTDAGYISVYSDSEVANKGNISLNDVTLKSGNINIKSVNGNVELGNVTITQRDKAENVLGLTDNKILSTGVKAPDTYRFDGVHVESTNANVIQKANTQIDSAGRVNLTAGGSVDATIKAYDLISATAKNDVNLDTLNTARLGDIKASNITVSGANILVDGKVKGDKINVEATDRLIVRPNFVLDEQYGHRTYGALEAKGDVDIVAQNGVYATEERLVGDVNAPMISSTDGKVNLSAPTGDIGSDVKISVYADDSVNANADNINLLLTGKDALVHDGNSYIPSVVPADGKVGEIVAKNDANISADGSLLQVGDGVAIKAGNDMNLDSANKNVGDPNNYLQVEVGGKLNADAPNGGVYIGTPEDLAVGQINAGKDVVIDAQEDVELGNVKAGEDVAISADAIKQNPETTENAKPAIEAGKDVDLVANAGDIGTPEDKVSVKAGGEINAEAVADPAENEKGDVNLDLVGPAELGKVEADNDVNIDANDDVMINDGIVAGNDVKVDAEGSILQADNNVVRPAISAGDDIKLDSAKEDIGAKDNYLTVDLGGELDAKAPEGSVYIEGLGDLNADNLVAGKDIEVKTPENLTVDNAQAGNDILLESGKDNTVGTVNAGENVDVVAGEDVLVKDKITAGNDLTIDAVGSIEQEVPEKVALKSGNDMILDSAKEDVGKSDKYLQVEVGGKLDAEAQNGGVYIGSPQDLTVGKIEAGKDVEIKTKGDLIQAENPANSENPAIISGGNMNLESAKEDVGDPENYLQVEVGGELTATAPEGGVYIGSPSDLVIDKVEAGKDVEIHTKGDLVQADPANTEDPRIISGEDMVLKSDKEDVGDPENYLQVEVGGELTAEAPEGGVYIGAKDDLVIDKIEAGKDVVIDGDGDVVQADPADPEDPRIIAGGDLTIDSDKEDVGDPENYLQVEVGGDINAEAPNGGVYIGQPPVDGPVVPDDGDNDDDTLTIDDRDQRSMKYLTDDSNDDASVRNNRQHLRYNVADTDYILVGSNTESGAQVQDVINISKQGMLVQTTDAVKVGENIEVTMDYKGLPFTVEGKVVRTDSARGTAGVEFNNIDRLTSSLILYLGMMENR